MKTKMLILAFLGLMFALKSNAQFNWQYNAPTFIGTDGILQTNCGCNTFFGNGGTQMTLDPNGQLGIGTTTPAFQLDVHAPNVIGQGINVFNAGQRAGYSINGQMFLWYGKSGNNTNIFSGVRAGTNTTSGYNAFYGYYAGNTNIKSQYNTFIGFLSGFSTNGLTGADGDYNTFVGEGSGYYNVTGQANCYYGPLTGYNNRKGSANSTFGDHSAQDVGGDLDSNSFYGFETGFNMTTGNSNVFVGDNSGYMTGNATTGSDNTFVGGFGGSTQLNPGGYYNVTLGYGADAYTGISSSPGAISNAAAIGAEALVLNNNQFIIGNTSQLCGMGMSTDPTGPMANLEIQTDLDQNVPLAFPFIGNGYWNTTNHYANTIISTGFSGLKFRDLTSQSTPVDPSSANFDPTTNPYPTGLLSVDGAGNVIYVPASSIIGNCTAPLNPPPGVANDPVIDLQTNTHNFWFEGNSSSSFDVNDVLIGYSCGFGPIPAKLNVRQYTGVPATSNLLQPSMGLYVENDDVRNYPTTGTGLSIPTIGIKSYMRPPNPAVTCKFLNIAGWFEAPKASCGGPPQYALFVPRGGGNVSIGFPYWNFWTPPTTNPALLWVNVGITTQAMWYPSDSSIKKNVTPFTYGIKTIRNLNPVSYNYNGIGGFDTSNRCIGLIAQNLMRNEPMAVKPITITKDSLSGDTETIENIYEQAVIYTAINAIKELDSTVSSNKHTDSIIQHNQQNTIDSLVNALQGIQTCLTTLCSNNHSPVHTNGGNGNAGDSTTAITNVQSIMLSASANAPLLYQNIPNPFSVGTKINYYLPEGTIGATLVFYDSYGNQMKTVELSQTGNGTLNITPDNLTAGIYSYSLIVNNTVIDTKRMILQK